MAGECLMVAQVRPGDVRPLQQLDALALASTAGWQLSASHPSPNTSPVAMTRYGNSFGRATAASRAVRLGTVCLA